jgi:hypothetical protein
MDAMHVPYTSLLCDPIKCQVKDEAPEDVVNVLSSYDTPQGGGIRVLEYRAMVE